MKIKPKRIVLHACAIALPFSMTLGSAVAQEENANSNIEEIVVTGKRSSIINSLREKQESDSIADILSGDDAGRLPDPNIAEALARIPGISFQRNNNTGEGAFISIRGLDSSFNTILHNGIRTGTSNSFRRTSLDILTSDNVSSVFVTKAPLPEHASEGIGGVVDIRTKGPLERRDRINLSVDARQSSFNDDVGSRLRFSFNKKFSDSFGINASLSRRRTFVDTIAINPASNVPEQLFPLELTGQNGTTMTFADNIDDDTVNALRFLREGQFPIENFTNEQIDYRYHDIERENITAETTIDWELNNSTVLTFGARYTSDDTIEDISILELDVDNDVFPDATDPTVQRLFDDSEVTFKPTIDDEDRTRERYFIRGETLSNNWTFDYVIGYSRAYENQPRFQYDFTNQLRDVAVDDALSDDDVDIAPFIFNGPIATPNPANPIALAAFLRALDPACTQLGDPTEPCGEAVDFDEELEDSRENERWTGRFDVNYEFTDHDFLQNIKFGIQYELSEFTERDIDIAETDDDIGLDPLFQGESVGNGAFGDNNLTIGENGLITGRTRNIGATGFRFDGFEIPIYNGNRARQIRNAYRAGFLNSGLSPSENLITEAEENFFSAYAQAKMTFGKLDIIGGVRIEQYDADFTGAVSFESNVEFIDAAGENDEISLASPTDLQNKTREDNFEVLPRITFNYNHSDKLKFRAAYSTSIARPTFDLLAASIDGTFDFELINGATPATATMADVDEVDISFETGNPDLKSSYAQNFDLSAEWYFDDDDALLVAVFYKEIDDFILNSFAVSADAFGSAATSVLDPATALAEAPFTAEGLELINQLGGVSALSSLGEAVFEQPSNGGQATVLGIEVGFNHSMDYLPGLLSNISIGANITALETEFKVDLGPFDPNDAAVQLGDAEAGERFLQRVDLFNSPELIYNGAIYYNGKNVETALAYRFSGRQLEEIQTFGLNQYQQERGFLDFDFEYAWRDVVGFEKVTLFFSANDILDDGDEFTTFETFGQGEQLSDFGSFNGRTYRAGVRARLDL